MASVGPLCPRSRRFVCGKHGCVDLVGLFMFATHGLGCTLCRYRVNGRTGSATTPFQRLLATCRGREGRGGTTRTAISPWTGALCSRRRCNGLAALAAGLVRRVGDAFTFGKGASATVAATGVATGGNGDRDRDRDQDRDGDGQKRKRELRAKLKEKQEILRGGVDLQAMDDKAKAAKGKTDRQADKAKAARRKELEGTVADGQAAELAEVD